MCFSDDGLNFLQEVVNGNDLIFKTKMNDLERELDAKTAELEAVHNELSSLHHTISVSISRFSF